MLLIKFELQNLYENKYIKKNNFIISLYGKLCDEF